MTYISLVARTLALLLVILPPLAAYASWRDFFGAKAEAQDEIRGPSMLSLPLLEGTHNPDPKVARGGGDIAIVDGEALAADKSSVWSDGVGGTHASPGEISVYVVREGDTISQIAEMFGVTPNTIRWANDIGAKESIRPGEHLAILPVAGVKHTVKKGDTLASLAKKYKGDEEEITQFNGLENGASLAVGDEIIIPNGEVVAPPSPKSSTGGAVRSYAGGPTYAGYYMRPVAGGVRTQGLHGYNGVDLASAYGAPIYAAAAGEVIISKGGGAWSGGYGNYVVVKHDNGTQTLYAHLSSNAVAVGDVVAQGDVIGAMGATGKATGTHLHFEIRGASNPF
ncbi:MAG: LysM peptidoglycan-binding domain-containing M23 family metallopeptidase [Patescibacteria group bacterium]